MKIVVAPDKFKGSLDAGAVARAIASGLVKAQPDVAVDLCPMADGGEGTVTALVAASGGRLVTCRVTGPLPETKVESAFGILPDAKTAIIEMCAASGLALLQPEDRNPLNTTTFGTGELIAAAVREGARRIILGIGGSATMDAGIGCAQACGFTVLLKNGEPTSMTEPLCGRDLPNVLTVKQGRGEITNGIEIIVACDVTIPLFGEQGSAEVFGPQKGATPQQVQWFDEQFRALAQRTDRRIQANTPGAGAAGGLGFGMLSFFGASLRGGFEIVAETTGLQKRLQGADLCFTGEGRLDAQSVHGKVVTGVSRLCRGLNVPCIALAGSIGDGADQTLAEGLSAYFAICDRPMSMEESCQQAAELIDRLAENCLRFWNAK